MLRKIKKQVSNRLNMSINNQENYFQLQKEKIKKQLTFAKENIPFYKEKLKDVDISKINTYEDFSNKIPILENKEVISNGKKFSSNLPILFVRHSSSTSGNPKEVFLTASDLRLWIEEGRLTITPYFKRGMIVAFSERKEKYYLSGLKEAVKYSGGKTLVFNPKDPKSLTNAIRTADILLDYAEMIYYISEQVKKLGLNFNKNIILSYTGNILEEGDIEKIKQNFNSAGIRAEIFSEYATSEIGPIGCSNNIEHNKFKIIYNDIVFIEVVNPETNKPSEIGEILVTCLNRTGSVFIRYRLGDVGSISFKGESPYFKLKGRMGIKVASVFFSPEQVFRIIRKELNSPIFCEIILKQDRFFSTLFINICAEKEFSEADIIKLKEKLLNELELEDDEDMTAKLQIKLKKGELNDSELRKGFKFQNE